MNITLSASIVGIVLSILTSFPLKMLTKSTVLSILAIQLGSIGGVYLGFSLAVDDKERNYKNDNKNVWNMFDKQTTIELISVIIMITFATKGIQYQSSLIISLGYIFHGFWDILHHYTLNKTKVPKWYIPFCTIFDFCLAIIIYFTF
jgi:hypothetical protein